MIEHRIKPFATRFWLQSSGIPSFLIRGVPIPAILILFEGTEEYACKMCYNLEDAEKENEKKSSDTAKIQGQKKGQDTRMERDNPPSGFALPVDQSDQLPFPRSLMGEHGFSRSQGEKLRG
jgi:hypothetical protein